MTTNPHPTTKFTIGLLSLVLFCGSAPAASLLLDTQFRTPLFAEPNPAVRTVLQPDGKFYLFLGADTLTDVRTGAITRYLPDGSLDTSFNFDRTYKVVEAAAPAPNGQLVVAVTRYTYSTNFGTEELLRVNADGSIDPTFATSIVQPFPYTSVRSIIVQPDGNTLVVGGFTDFNQSGRQNIVRLLADGTIDSSFNPPQFLGGFYGIYPKPFLAGDKILVAGDFTQVNGSFSPGVARLNFDGSLDTSFQASGFDRVSSTTPIRGIGTTSDGKILVAGRFRNPQIPNDRMPIIRLNPDGSLDTTYSTTQFTLSDIGRDLVIQPDDKAIVVMNTSIYRVDSAGASDSSFIPPSFVDITYDPLGYEGITNTISLQPDGRIIVAGTFTDVNPAGNPGDSHYGIVRVNSDGSVDNSFVTTHRTGFEDYPTSFARLSDGSVLTSFQPFSRHDPFMAFNLGRLLADGSQDTGFTLSSSDPGGILSTGFLAKDFVRLVDGAFFVFGDLGGAKFLSNGSQDLGFQLSAPYFQKATITADGKVILSAGTSPDATVWGPLSQIRRDGSSDAAFLPPPEIFANQVIREQGELYQLYVGSHVLAIQPNGKILYLFLSSDQYYHLIRLNPDGSQDPGFPAVSLDPVNLYLDYPVVWDPFNGGLVQPPGGHIAPRRQSRMHMFWPMGVLFFADSLPCSMASPARGIVRLMEDGTIDSTFNVGAGPQWTTTTETTSFFPFVEAMEEQVDGNLLIAGTFEAFNGTPLPGIASLSPDGSVDTSFVAPAERKKFAGGTANLARQPDGSFLLSGPYSFPAEPNAAFIHINSVGGVPVVGSPPQATAIIGQPFSYQIEASGQPTSYSATGLPPGFTIDPNTGVITGTPNSGYIGIYVILITATNDDGTSTAFYLTLTVPPSPDWSHPHSAKHFHPPESSCRGQCADRRLHYYGSRTATGNCPRNWSFVNRSGNFRRPSRYNLGAAWPGRLCHNHERQLETDTGKRNSRDRNRTEQ